MGEMKRTTSPWTLPFREFTTAWTRALALSFTAAADANRVALATFPERVDNSVEPAPTESLAYVKSDWQLERSVDLQEDLAVGDYVKFSKTISDDDVLSFADASGDTNRLHLDESFVEATRFGERIAHGALISGLISAAVAALPGTVIYLSQELSFLGPAHIGDRLTAECRIVEQLGDDRYRLATTVRNSDGETIVEGDATILVDPLPD
jgi:acyl dehydratase